MDFDEIIRQNAINYGIIKGNNIIVFIVVGKKGAIYGYKNKYLIMAQTINKEYGYTVICSENISNPENILNTGINIIKNYCIEKKFYEYKIYYIGVSNGAIIGTLYGTDVKEIKKMLLINMPLMINFHKIKEKLKENKDKKIIFIYGSLDPSFKYIELLNYIENTNLKIISIENQNHNFSKDINEFISLPQKYLF